MADDSVMACTLAADTYRARLASISELARDALRRVERHGVSVTLHYAPEAATRVGVLVEQERACCAFLTFEVREGEDEISVRITAPRAAADTLPELFSAFTGQS